MPASLPLPSYGVARAGEPSNKAEESGLGSFRSILALFGGMPRHPRPRMPVDPTTVEFYGSGKRSRRFFPSVEDRAWTLYPPFGDPCSLASPRPPGITMAIPLLASQHEAYLFLLA